jgi:tetratricopeptide (TPR) repeat protein
VKTPPTRNKLLFALALIGLPSGALAESSGLVAGSKGLIHRVSDKGETYEDLADFYYGKRYLSLHLRLFNGRSEPLQKGTSIIIPTYALLPLKRGQTIAMFAEQNLSDPGRADYLAELHGLKPKDRQSPKPGIRFRVVESLKHVVRPGETLRSIARVYYRDVSSERLRLIILYNKLASGSVKPGMALRIPLDSPEFSREAVLLRAKRSFERTEQAEELADASDKSDRPEKDKGERKAPLRKRARFTAKERGERDDDDLPKGDSPAPEVEKSAAPKRIDDLLEELERTCSDGDYKECDERGKQIFASAPQNATSARAEILRLRAVALVALARIEESKSVFRQLLKLDPDYDLDLYRTSPKILDVFQAVAER